VEVPYSWLLPRPLNNKSFLSKMTEKYLNALVMTIGSFRGIVAGWPK
jgi:hypothetical protein